MIQLNWIIIFLTRVYWVGDRAISPMVHNRLCKLSAKKKIFDTAKNPYNDALLKSGFNPLDKFKCSTQPSKKKFRRRNIINFHRPYCNSVKTKVGKHFLNLINTHFPESYKLHKIFNKNTLKVTYSCSTNLKLIIQEPNKKVHSEPSSTDKLCNCTSATQCPFNSQCLQKGIYKAITSHQI